MKSFIVTFVFKSNLLLSHLCSCQIFYCHICVQVKSVIVTFVFMSNLLLSHLCSCQIFYCHICAHVKYFIVTFVFLSTYIIYKLLVSVIVVTIYLPLIKVGTSQKSPTAMTIEHLVILCLEALYNTENYY